MARAIRVHETGGPEVLKLEEISPGPLDSGVVRVRNTAIGLNYIDTYHRSGLYPLPLPTGIGLEAAGIVEEVGEGCSLSVGQRVVYCSAGFGAYADVFDAPETRLARIPDGVADDVAAAVLLKGQTVEYLLNRTAQLGEGDHCLFHAAAGGVGLLFGQWAASQGIVAIGTVSTEEKAEQARAAGYAHVILSGDDVCARVQEITHGAKLPVVYDGVGRDTFFASLDCLAPRGLMVSFGNASGAPDPLDLQQLSLRGSLYVTRPTLVSYTATTEDFRASADAVLGRVADGRLQVSVNQRYPLEEAAQAHRDLEARKTTGSTVLIPAA